MIAFWLMPAREEKAFFAGLIAQLGARFDAPVFEPHVTLFGGAIDQESALERLKGTAAASSACQLEIDQISISEAYTKTLFVQFRASPGASSLSAALSSECGDYHFDPHLSLLYKDMGLAMKEHLAREIQPPFERVSFDALKVITCPAEIRRRKDVEAWRTLCEQRLQARPG